MLNGLRPHTGDEFAKMRREFDISNASSYSALQIVTCCLFARSSSNVGHLNFVYSGDGVDSSDLHAFN